MKKTFKIGDTVKVIDSGGNYSTYEAWAKEHKLNLYKSGFLKEDLIGEVVAIGEHTSMGYKTLIGILIDNQHYIIDDDCVEHYKENKKHKHHDVIIAYANGDKIQTRFDKRYDWEDVKNPHFYDHIEYRIKPETKPDFSLYAEVLTTDGKFGHAKFFGNVLTQEDNVKFTFDGKTKKLKAVELIK
jgi:transcription antitermination factor NusG